MPNLAYIHLSYKSNLVAQGEIVTAYSDPNEIKRYSLERAVRRLVDKKQSSTEGYSISKVVSVRPIQGLTPHE